MLKNYKNFKDEMEVRDFLALDRTILANERTLLAYFRTFIGTFSAGIALVKLFDAVFTNITGYIFILISPFFMIFGLVRFIQVSKKMKTLHSDDDNTDED